MSKAALYGSIR